MIHVPDLTFSIAGFTFSLRAAPHLSRFDLPPDYAAFRSTEVSRAPAASYDVVDADESSVAAEANASAFWTCQTWRLCRAAQDRLAVQIVGAADSTWRTAALVTADFFSGRIFRGVSRGGLVPDTFAIDYPLDRILVTNRLAQLNAGIVHASAVSYRGQALLFCGRSGAGKTTIARVLREAGAAILNDDRAAIRLERDAVSASATPWHGEDPEMRADVLPLGGIFFLRQAPENRLTPLSPVIALASLLANTAAPFYLREGLEKITDTWAGVVERVPAFEFAFTPDRRAREALDHQLKPTR